MTINRKIISFIVFGFLLVSVVFTYHSIDTLRKNQNNNLDLFKKEFLELSRELFDKNSNLFFDSLDLQTNNGSETKTILDFINKTHPDNNNIAIFDIKGREFLDKYNNEDLVQFLTPVVIDGYIKENILNQKSSFGIDNFDEFSLDKTNTIIPHKIHVHVYREAGIIVGFGQNFLTGKVRIEFIERQNEALLKSQIYLSVLIFTIIFTLIIFFMIMVMEKIVIKPLREIVTVVKSITIGSLYKKIDIKSKDEIGQLGMVFNEMTDKLRESYATLEDKIKERTQELDIKVKEITENNKELENNKTVIVNLLEDFEEEKINAEKLVVLRTKELSDEKARLLASINSISFGFIIADMDHRVLLKNDAIVKLFGLKEGDEISINNISELLGNHLDIKAQIKLCVKDKKLCELKEIAFKNKFFRGIISPILTPEKKQTIGYVFLLEDITEARAIDKAKTEFVSLASHQLRTPLSAINWYTEMLLSGDAGKLNEEQSEFLEDIITSSKRMSSLVGTLLNVSRIELGTFAVNPENSDIWEIIKDEVEDLKVQFDDKKIELELLADLKQVFVFVDPKLMSIVVQNLLTNSIKYNSSGGKVSISVDKKEETGEVILSVFDTGYGIPKENQGKIFTKMYRADNAVAIDAEGNGIGLYMVKSILETSGCTISFESPPLGKEKGTAFYVHIPKEGMKQIKAEKRLGDVIS